MLSTTQWLLCVILGPSLAVSDGSPRVQGTNNPARALYIQPSTFASPSRINVFRTRFHPLRPSISQPISPLIDPPKSVGSLGRVGVYIGPVRRAGTRFTGSLLLRRTGLDGPCAIAARWSAPYR
ncbi:hypothetical protein C2E23DRAFT_232317 [Lenzites betulinus]|nr:hypothetical protein C2E23DRAFT_232317 [Lenzites betulinus]